MAWLAAIVLVGGFILLLKPFRVIRNSQETLTLSREVMTVLGNKQLSELEKEKAMQRHSLAFMRYFVLILAGCAGALLLPLGLVWILDLAGLSPLDDAIAITMSWPFLLGSTVVGIAVLVIQSRTGPKA